MEASVERFNTQEQPRVEAILDSANANLTQTQGLVQDVRGVVERFNTQEQPRVETIMDSANGDLVEAQGLVQDVRRLLWIDRPDARLDEELSPEEKKRKDELTAERDQLVSRVKEDQASIDYMKTHYGELDRIVELQQDLEKTGQQLALVIQQIDLIVHKEPGPLTETIVSVNAVVERFNTEEQPRIDKILDSLNQTVLESQKTMQEAEANIVQARALVAGIQAVLFNQWVKISAIAVAGLLSLILLFSVIVLFRLAFRV